MNEIAILLCEAAEAGSENVLGLEDIRDWLTGYLQFRQEEAARFPEEANVAHWDMSAADYNPDADAMFVFAIFRGERVTFLAGRALFPLLREFCENSFPDNIDDVLNEVSVRFQATGSATVSLGELIRWLKN